MSLADAGTIPVSAETPEGTPLDGDGKREAPTPAKVKLALQPLKEAIAAVEQHCEKFSGRGRFDGRGTAAPSAAKATAAFWPACCRAWRGSLAGIAIQLPATPSR